MTARAASSRLSKSTPFGCATKTASTPSFSAPSTSLTPSASRYPRAESVTNGRTETFPWRSRYVCTLQSGVKTWSSSTGSPAPRSSRAKDAGGMWLPFVKSANGRPAARIASSTSFAPGSGCTSAPARCTSVPSTAQTKPRTPERSPPLVEDRDGAGRAVDADALTGADLRRRATRADDGRQTVLAAHDRCMRHHPADVGYDRGHLREDGRPGRRRDAADEDFAVPHVGELADGLHDPRNALDDSRRRRRPAELRAAVLAPRPLADALGGEAPQHVEHRVVHLLGRCPDRRRRSPVAEPLEDLLAAGDDRRPVLRADRRAARRPHQDELVQSRCDLVA